MKSFAGRNSANNWVMPVTALSLVLGFMLVTASITATNRGSRFSLLGNDQRVRFNTGQDDIQQKYIQLSSEVSKLRDENSRLQKAVGDNSKSANVLNESLNEAKAFAALTDLQGPGIKVTLLDSKRQLSGFGGNDNIIHDVDILKVTNELFASGAEAVDVNGQRVAATTSFRCAGPVIYFDNVHIASPFVIRAIGDPAALLGGMNLPGGILDEIKQTDPSMVMIEQVKDMKMIAYAGSTSRKFGRVPTEAK
jgi:uncharacterized protein YlxW (UPF0749 family)